MQQIGPYTLLEEIARGGHGVVYRAQDAQGQVVALKLLLAHLAQNEQARKRFQAEVNALARLRHSHVVPILAAGEHEGCPWLALEYVEGESLETRLRRGPLPIHEAIRVARQLAQALSYVHSCGLLHRDLKPDNVLLRGNEALLTDFGLVLDEQASVSRITATGVFQGTPGYWAPEQARGETHEHGEQTDVYGLGAVLYACLTGSAPVQGLSLQEYLQTIRFRQVPSPRKVRSDVPSWLSELCMRCLATVPESRPGSADEVARGLVLAGTGVKATGASPRRGRLVVVLAGAIGVLGLVSLGWWALRAEAPLAEPLSPEDTQGQALVEAGDAKLQAGRYAEAIEDYDKALELDLGAAEADRVHQFHAAAVAKLAAEGDQRQQAQVLVEAGDTKFQAGRYAEAIEDYDKALELDARIAQAYANRGLTKMRLERYAEAIEDYDKALELDPRTVLAYAIRGVSKAKLGRSAEAIEDLDKALELDPRNAVAYTTRGWSKANLGRYAEALEDYDKALELDLPQATADQVKQWRAEAVAKLTEQQKDN